MEQDYLADFPSFGPASSSSSLSAYDKDKSILFSPEDYSSHRSFFDELEERENRKKHFQSVTSSSLPPAWRLSSISNVVAVGESSTAGCFSLLQMDLRCSRPVVQEIRQTRRMLWPLRVQGYNVFVSSVFAGNELCGRIRQIDLRYDKADE